jgi:DNA-binding NtrC family response regulator
VPGREPSCWRLIARRDGRSVLEAPVPLGVSTIGRDKGNRFVLDGERMSRFHACIVARGDGTCHVHDMGSKNGMVVDGRHVGRVRVVVRETIGMGPYVLELEAVEAATGPGDVPTAGDALAAEAEAAPDDDTFLGASAATRQLLARARRVADTDLSALIQGESGTGKGVIARLIHRWSARRSGPFVVVNCAAIPTELVESELFGHRKGAFTGAVADRPGKFRAASGGTLFLDEVGDLSLQAQAKILRAIEEREIEPVGEPATVQVDVRVVAATHRNLEGAVAEGHFRLDLHHRLAIVRLDVPPLRERKDDIPVLASFFLSELIDDIPWAQGATLSRGAMEALVAHDWPGNVRELRNAIAQGLLAHDGEYVEPEDLRLGGAHAAAGPATSPEATLAEAEAAHVMRALEFHGGNIRRTAKTLGISRTTLHDRMDRLGLSRPQAQREPEEDDER